jgi:hypothetical protein
MKKTFLLVLVAVATINAIAQNTRLAERNNIAWIANTTTVKLTNKTSAFLEYHWRRADWVRDWQQSLVRTGVQYQLNNNVQLRAGYAWIETFPYGTYTLNAMGKQFTEHRLFQTVLVTQKINKTDLSHRFMLEQRFVGRYSNAALQKEDEFVSTNRLRYMLRLQQPLSKKPNEKLYAAAYNELFISFGENVNENVFDQNRAGLMIGYRANKNFRIEGGFLSHIQQLGREINTRNAFQYNRGLIINSFINIDRKNTPRQPK